MNYQDTDKQIADAVQPTAQLNILGWRIRSHLGMDASHSPDEAWSQHSSPQGSSSRGRSSQQSSSQQSSSQQSSTQKSPDKPGHSKRQQASSSQSRPASEQTGINPDSEQQTRTIVFAEDDPDDQYLIRTALQDTEYDINLVCVNDGDELMSYLDQAGSPPDIILLDLNMPGTDGMTLLKQLKSSERYEPIPVIIYSTSNAEEDVTQCYRLGANAYIVKPMRFEEIRSLVQSLCEYWFHIVKLHTS